MMSMLVAKFRDQQGQAMVELALVIPLIILLILAVIDFGRIYSAQLILNHAVRAGARAAVVLDTGTYNTYDLAKAQILLIVQGDDQYISVASVSVTPNTPFPWAAGSYITVSAPYKVQLEAPIVRHIFGDADGKYQIESQVTMRRE